MSLPFGSVEIESNGATEAVLAEQRSLRTAQHFDALEVEQVDGGAGEGALVDVVDVDADARIRREDVVARLHAAHADERRRTAEAALWADVGVGNDESRDR